MYDGRTRLAEEVVAWVRERFPLVTLQAVIPRAVRVSEAPSFNRTVITHDRRSPGAIAYLEAAIEMANRGAQLGR
jgi:chromosome partitioning protein